MKEDSSQKNIEDFSREIEKAAGKNEEAFLTWFNNNENYNAMIVSGYKDFYCSILKDEIYTLTKKNSKNLTALEIGCGGGRIMNAASKYFKYVIGLDIHDNLKDAEKFLRQMGNINCETKKITNSKFPLANNSVDFIYSFIVFQHLMNIEIFSAYLKEVSRILKENGSAIIYFGRPRFLSKLPYKNTFFNKLSVFLDKIFFEEIYLNFFKGGLMEYPKAETNYVNLVVSRRKAEKMFKRFGFKIIDKGMSGKNKGYGSQYYFSFKK